MRPVRERPASLTDARRGRRRAGAPAGPPIRSTALSPGRIPAIAYKKVEDARAWQRRRYRRQTADRLARGLCPKCGKHPPAPDRSRCRQCLEQRRAADRASYARAKAEGRLYGGSDAEANLGNRRDAFETMRDLAADAYRVETGDTWRPRHGSHVSQTGNLTSAAIDARDFRRARKDREARAHIPEGTLVAVTGGKQVADADIVWTTLDRTRAKHADMVLLHGGGPGVETVAARWAEARGVHQLVCRPNWNAHGKAAPFRRNDELLDLLPKGVIAFPGSGITGNLVDKATKLGIPVHRVAP